MDIKAYIASGILELYIAGILSEKENEEVYALMQQYPEIFKEVIQIETAIIKLTASVSNHTNTEILKLVKQKLGLIDKEVKIIPISKRYNWVTYTGWAAAVVLAGGLFWTLNQNNQLKTNIKVAEIQQSLLETKIEISRSSIAEANALINVLRSDEVFQIPLNGQGNFKDTYAKVYWDKNEKRIFLDAQGLPNPPKGKVYQVWSLTLNPLTPTSLGTIEEFIEDSNKIFEINNPNLSEAFGITLEPEGGSLTPTMDQLHTLGVVSS